MFRRRPIVYLVGVVLILILVIQLPIFRNERDAIRLMFSYPAKALDNVTSRVSGAFKVLFAINDLNNENQRLKDDNTKLKADLAASLTTASENASLRDALGFKQSHPNLKLTPANVIGYSPTAVYQAITINRGTKDGLAENQAVISGGFLIGKVHNISEHTAEVWLVGNRNLLTPVMLANDQTVGLMTGGIRGLIIENIPLDTKVSTGDIVVTSALEGLYPAGIAVGTVTDVISPKEEIFLTLRVSNPVSIGNLTSVFVVSQ